MTSRQPFHFVAHRRAVALAACTGVLLVSGALGAAETSAGDGRNERLEHLRAACLLNRPNANVEACMEEALAARQAAPQGELQDGAAPYQRNAVLRCRALPAADQPACEARVRGSGKASGSVEEGGILRELVVREQAPAANALPTNSGVPGPMRVDPTKDGLSDTVPAQPTAPHGPQLPR